MTKYQESYLRMSAAKLFHVLNNPAIISNLPNSANYINSIQTATSQIQAVNVQQEINKTGSTVSKGQLRINLYTLGADIARRILAYGTNIGNMTLVKMVSYSKSDLKRASEQNLICMCQVIKDNATANAANLATYGVTETMISTLQTNITNFNASLAKIRVNTSDSSEATKLMGNYFKTLSTTWQKFDILVEIVQDSHPSFYNEYVKLSKVIIIGKGALDLKVKVLDASTGLGEQNVNLVLSPTSDISKALSMNGKAHVMKKTYKGGSCYYKNLSNGTYLLVASKPGFKNKEMIVNIVKGELVSVTIELEKL